MDEINVFFKKWTKKYFIRNAFHSFQSEKWTYARWTTNSASNHKWSVGLGFLVSKLFSFFRKLGDLFSQRNFFYFATFLATKNPSPNSPESVNEERQIESQGSEEQLNPEGGRTVDILLMSGWRLRPWTSPVGREGELGMNEKTPQFFSLKLKLFFSKIFIFIFKKFLFFFVFIFIYFRTLLSIFLKLFFLSPF